MKKMILLLLLLWLFTGCASTEQTVSEAESSDSEQLLSSCESESSVQELETEENPTPWLAETPTKCEYGQIQIPSGELYLYQEKGFLIGEYWYSIRWNCKESLDGFFPDGGHALYPQGYFSWPCNDVKAILGPDYLVGFRELDSSAKDSDDYDEKRPKKFMGIECFIIEDGKFNYYPVEIWHQNDYSSDPPLEISYDPDTRTAEVSSILMTAKVQMDTGETATKFSTERLKKANEEAKYVLYALNEAVVSTLDGKYEIGVINDDINSHVYFSKNTQTGEETYIAYGSIPGSSIAISNVIEKREGYVYREMTEKERRARMGPDITEIMRLDGYTLYFPYWNIAYNIETGEQVE